mmetsp:Transcript_8720/g.35591  ORF Transcript_8720/g.35591 Transcript_8720/m.35591 type:complete len:270 (+) Transcript_8720:252-1061(+)|eukprot:PRCOL_00001114-RA
MQALRAPARCSLFDKGDALSGGGATRRRRRGGGSGTGNAGRGAAQRQQEERGAKREYADSREAEARWYAVQTQMGRQDDIERFARQKDVVALGGFECHTPMLTQYTRTSKGLLSERKVPVTAGMSIIKFKYSREMMFLIGQSKLFVRFLSRKTTWSTSSMNMKVIDADTDPGEPLTQEEVDWMFRSEEQDGGEYTSMTERGRDPNEVIKTGLETNDLVEVIADGPFKGFEGHVVEILDDERLIISLSVFGKDTPMEMAKAHVKQLAVGQ